MSTETDIKPHLIIPHYIYASDMGCVGQKICGIINGLSSKFGFCIAKDDYLGEILGMEPRSVQRQIQLLIKDGKVKNIGTSHHRKLVLGYLAKEEKEEEILMDEKRRNFAFEAEKRRNFAKKRRNFAWLPIIYNKYIYIVQNEFEPVQISDEKMFEELFELFWDAYPRKEKKKQAKQAFERLGENEMDTLLSRIKSIQTNYQDKEKQFIPLPTSFINGERWEDETFGCSGNVEKFQKKGGAELTADFRLDALIGRFSMLCDGAGVEMTALDNEVLRALDMSITEVIEMINDYGIDRFKEDVMGVWEDAVSCAA